MYYFYTMNMSTIISKVKATMVHCIFVTSFITSCNTSNNNPPVAITQNNITLIPKGLTGNDAIVLYKNGNTVNLNKALALNEDLDLKLFLTGFTPINGSVYMQASITLLHASNVKDTLYHVPKYFSDQYSTSNGDARFVQLNVPIRQLKKQVDSILVNATVVDVKSQAAVEAIFGIKLSN
jgi:hypothetical protein